jgi:hypothetical protein
MAAVATLIPTLALAEIAGQFGLKRATVQDLADRMQIPYAKFPYSNVNGVDDAGLAKLVKVLGLAVSPLIEAAESQAAERP